MSDGWVPAVGDRVVEFTDTRGMGTAHITPAVVVKVGKRDAVLDNGERWNINNLRKRRGAWDPNKELLLASDPRVARARKANARSRCEAAVSIAFDDWRKGKSPEAASALRSALDAWEAAL